MLIQTLAVLAASAVLATGAPLSANMSETVTPWKFNVEGESGLESDE